MDDRDQKGIYNANAGEIFWRNFLAGASRALGGIFVYLIFVIILSAIFVNLVLPKILPMIESYTNILNSLSGPKSQPSYTISPQDLQKFLGR